MMGLAQGYAIAHHRLALVAIKIKMHNQEDGLPLKKKPETNKQ